MDIDPKKLEEARARRRQQVEQIPSQPPKRTFASKLPAIVGGTIGGIVGGLATGPGGGLGAIPAAGVGYATGEQLYRTFAPGQQVMQPMEFGKEAAIAGAFEASGGLVTKGISATVKATMPSILKTMQAIPSHVSKWVIDKGIGKTLKDFTKVDPELPSQLIHAFQETVAEGRRIAGEKYGVTITFIAKKMANKRINISPAYKKTINLIDSLTSDPSFTYAVDKKGLATLRNIKISLTNFQTQGATIEEALMLRKGLKAIIEYPKPGVLPKYGKIVNSKLKEIYFTLNKQLHDIKPIKDADASFRIIAHAYDTVEPILKGTDLEVKVLNIMKRGTDASRKLEMIDKLVSGQASQLDAIRDAVAKLAFKEPFRGSIPFGPLAVAGATTAGIYGGVDAFLKTLAIIPTLLMATSPRLAGYSLKAGEQIFARAPAHIARHAVPLSIMAEYERQK